MSSSDSSSDTSDTSGTPKTHPFGLRTFMELFDVGPMIAIGAFGVSALVVLFALFYFVHSAPPTTLTLSSGPPGSVFYRNAQKYAAILKENGVKVNVLTSNGSLENLTRLASGTAHVDVGIAQSGLTLPGTDDLVSLGSISYQPLLVFYRGAPIELLSQLAGKKVAVGAAGSGTRNFALALLAPNGIPKAASPGVDAGSDKTELLDWDADAAAVALLDHKIDAAFVMSESASQDIMRKLMRSGDVRLFNFKQAAAYSRKIDYLNMLELPEGAVDLGLDIPAHDVQLLGPTVELVATKRLHPALSDLLLEAATQVHSRPGTFQKRGEFPAPIEHALKISEDAARFYKSGKSFFYRYLPFWLASLLSRFVVVFVPMLVILIPVLKSIPGFFRWRMQKRIHRRYRELLALEQDLLNRGVDRDVLRRHFDQIEEAINKMHIPASFADQFYGLRGHIDYVRQLVDKAR